MSEPRDPGRPPFTDESPDVTRLRSFWDSRYRTFALSESGWAGAGEVHNRLVYRCKVAAIARALRRAGYTADRLFSVLDAGCGQGFFADFYARAFPRARYTGLDVSSRLIAHLRASRPEAEFETAEITTWNAGGRRFDVVQSIEVLHLLLDDALVATALRNIGRWLTPGGVALVTAVLPTVTESRLGYLRFQARRDFEAMIQQAGLRLDHDDPMYYFLPDGGPSWAWSRPLCHRLPRRVLYAVDRLALTLHAPRVATGPDSMMRLLTLAARPA